jgi:TPR repeat protein
VKTNRLRWFLFFLLVSAVLQLPAQQTEADSKLLADIRAKAEKGDAQSQCVLGEAFAEGNLGVARNEVEAVKWFRKAAKQNDLAC